MKRVLIVLLLFSFVRAQLLDLDDGVQNFIIQTKQIHIPGFEGAFNASIVSLQEKNLMSFRVRDQALISTFQIGLVFLDKDFNVVGTPQILNIKKDSASFLKYQDPRLIIIGETIYIVFSNTMKWGDIVAPRMFIAPLQIDNEQRFFIDQPLCLRPFEGETKRWEKNWVPFKYNEELLFAYSLLPHRIFKPLNTGECLTQDLTYSLINWQWGELRGGTPAVKIDEGYLAFFHSSKVMSTKQSAGKKIQHYFMGAYIFASEPPFMIKKISPEPLIHKTFYNGAMHNTWKPLRVIFPMGLHVEGNDVWVVYGKQDHEIWVAKIDKRGLLNNLIDCPVISNKEGAVLLYHQKQMLKECIDNEFQENEGQGLDEDYEKCM